jgi:hypothetical protein
MPDSEYSLPYTCNPATLYLCTAYPALNRLALPYTRALEPQSTPPEKFLHQEEWPSPPRLLTRISVLPTLQDGSGPGRDGHLFLIASPGAV